MRLIDIDDISLRKTIACGGLSAKALWKRIQQQPTVDAVEVVRCRDCKHFVDEGFYCAQNILPMFDHFYCYYGERKESEQ